MKGSVCSKKTVTTSTNIWMPRERYQKECLIPTVKHGGGSVMVWGGISSSGVVPLLRIVGITKKETLHLTFSFCRCLGKYGMATTKPGPQ